MSKGRKLTKQEREVLEEIRESHERLKQRRLNDPESVERPDFPEGKADFPIGVILDKREDTNS